MMRWRFLKKGFTLSLSLLLMSLGGFGCGGTSKIRVSRLNAEMDPADFAQSIVQLPSRGWFGMIQDFKNTRFTCEQLARHMKARLSSLKNKKESIRLDQYCEDKKNRLILKCAQPLAPGEYWLEIQSTIPEKAEASAPQIFVEYTDPNFGAAAEQLSSGAIALEKNATLSGVIDLSQGKKTAWYRVTGTHGSPILGYVVPGTPLEQPLSVTVYQMSEDLKPLRELGVLKNKVEKKFTLSKLPLLVQVEGPLFSGEMKYSIFRKDAGDGTPGGESPPPQVHFPLIERYVLSKNQAVLVIQANDQIKVGSQLVVFGRRGNGKKVELGQCSVVSIQAIQASCQLNQVNLAGVTQLQVELAEGE